ncbi:MAG: mandelate racemase/muconate lactonizing protein [Chloroflexi bacterium]|nr:mandelate racemase/muconate lactonizing protein [Chloroflexota bacterium]
MHITYVRCERLEGLYESAAGHSVARQVAALDIYPEYRGKQPFGGEVYQDIGTRPISEVYVFIDTDEGITGLFGPIYIDQAFQIETRLRPYLLGQDPCASERIWDILSRQDRHARRGYMMMAISAIDMCLWDIRGKALGLPVYRLLGGPTREAIPVYVSTLGYPTDPERVYAQAQAFLEEGYTAQKWFFPCGPGDGRAGMEANLEMVRAAREAVGDRSALMFDAWLGWDVPYAIEMGRRMAPYNPAWLEEPVPPDRIGAYAEIRRSTGIPIAGGEHEYTRWGFKVLLDAEGVDVVQADPDWAGGITEMIKICGLASAYDKPVVPHGHSTLPALHLIAAQSPGTCPMLEFLIVHNPSKQWFHRDQYFPEHGMMRLPETPGLGIILDEKRILQRTRLSWN